MRFYLHRAYAGANNWKPTGESGSYAAMCKIATARTQMTGDRHIAASAKRVSKAAFPLNAH